MKCFSQLMQTVLVKSKFQAQEESKQYTKLRKIVRFKNEGKLTRNVNVISPTKTK